MHLSQSRSLERQSMRTSQARLMLSRKQMTSQFQLPTMMMMMMTMRAQFRRQRTILKMRTSHLVMRSRPKQSSEKNPRSLERKGSAVKMLILRKSTLQSSLVLLKLSRRGVNDRKQNRVKRSKATAMMKTKMALRQPMLRMQSQISRFQSTRLRTALTRKEKLIKRIGPSSLETSRRMPLNRKIPSRY